MHPVWPSLETGTRLPNRKWPHAAPVPPSALQSALLSAPLNERYFNAIAALRRLFGRRDRLGRATLGIALYWGVDAALVAQEPFFHLLAHLTQFDLHALHLAFYLISLHAR